MATAPAKINSAGIQALLDILRSRTLSYGAIDLAVRAMQAAEDERDELKKELERVNTKLERAQVELKSERRSVAELVIDLSKLDCPATEIKKAWPGYSNHEIAEWIKL